MFLDSKGIVIKEENVCSVISCLGKPTHKYIGVLRRKKYSERIRGQNIAHTHDRCKKMKSHEPKTVGTVECHNFMCHYRDSN